MNTPLSPTEFERLLKSGHGRAALHIKHFGLADVADRVLAACLHNLSYDRQCESSRAQWLFSLFKDTPERPRFAAALIQAVENGEQGYDLRQCMEIAALLARDGDKLAFDALNRRALEIAEMDPSDGSVATPLISIRGLDGLVDLARLYGSALLEAEHAEEDEADEDEEYEDEPPPPLDCLGLEPMLDARNYLARFSDEKAIAAYLAYNDGQIKQRPTYYPLSCKKRRQARRAAQPLTQILQHLEKPNTRHFTLAGWGGDLTRRERRLLAQRLQEETCETVCLNLLYVFRDHPPERLSPKLFELAESGSRKLRAAAYDVLSHFDDPSVAELAQRLLDSPDFPDAPNGDDGRIRLFTSVLRRTDAERIEAKLHRIDHDERSLHRFGFDIRHMAAMSQSPLLAGLLYWVYENDPCTLCRGAAVDRLAERAALPDRLLEEGRFDAEEDVRARVKEEIARRGSDRGTGLA